MISKRFGKKSKTILATTDEGLELYEKKILKDFIHPEIPGDRLPILYQRPKTIAERLYRTVSYNPEKGSFQIHPRRAKIWNWVLVLIVALMLIGYGTCFVGANVKFSGGIKRFFFVIALLAGLTEATVFSWIVRVVGGDWRDVANAFIAFIALSLVVTQVRVSG